MDDKAEKSDGRGGIDVILAEDGEKGPRCAHGECENASEWARGKNEISRDVELKRVLSRASSRMAVEGCQCQRKAWFPGPTLLFEKVGRGGAAGRRFYACSACRDRKDCNFFQWEGEKVRGFFSPHSPGGINERGSKTTAALM